MKRTFSCFKSTQENLFVAFKKISERQNGIYRYVKRKANKKTLRKDAPLRSAFLCGYLEYSKSRPFLSIEFLNGALTRFLKFVELLDVLERSNKSKTKLTNQQADSLIERKRKL